MPGGIKTAIQDGVLRIGATGEWTIHTAEAVRQAIDRATAARGQRVVVDLSGLRTVDTAGALLIKHLRDHFTRQGQSVDLTGIDDRHKALVERVLHAAETEPLPAAGRQPVLDWVASVGRATHEVYLEAADLLYFLGVATVVAGRCIIRPARIRFISVLSHIENVGLNALPIVGLLSFLIGIVVAYQGADQLRRFGAEIFTVNLLGVSILREMGILLAAIVIAGRSGSAFAAQIGTMKVNQEVDAMRTLGLDPVEILVMPRLIALVIAMPLLAVYADIMGLLGGGLMVVLTLDVSFTQFVERLHEAVTLTTFWVGLVKAPVFGFAIALTGCREGLKVTGSAESVGHHTTRAVVISIFLVIVADALFSILFSALGI
jgi:phospholipid/cholesterol/gamma-HCH transport system permease protein